LIALGAAIVAVGVFGLCLIRLLVGPTHYDRIIAANLCVFLVVVAAVALAVLSGDGEGIYVAITLIVALLVTNIAVFKFFYTGTFQAAIASPEDEA
jgi:multicomponent Na+:H+ antiporter subunit F